MIDSDRIIAPETVSDPARIRALLARQVRHLLARPNGRGRPKKHIVRLVLPLEHVNPFRWLQAQDARARLYWSGREGAVETAAVGEADVCRSPAPAGFEAMRRQLTPVLASCDAQVRYYGGLRFDPAQPAAGTDLSSSRRQRKTRKGRHRRLHAQAPRYSQRHSQRPNTMAKRLKPKTVAQHEGVIPTAGFPHVEEA